VSTWNLSYSIVSVLLTATGVHILIPLNIYEYSPMAFCKLPGTVRSLCRAKVCIHVCIGLLIKCALSEWFNFQSRLNKISFIYIELENIFNRKCNVFAISDCITLCRRYLTFHYSNDLIRWIILNHVK
jgi:hypothetical protein